MNIIELLKLDHEHFDPNRCRHQLSRGQCALCKGSPQTPLFEIQPYCNYLLPFNRGFYSIYSSPNLYKRISKFIREQGFVASTIANRTLGSLWTATEIKLQ